MSTSSPSAAVSSYNPKRRKEKKEEARRRSARLPTEDNLRFGKCGQVCACVQNRTTAFVDCGSKSGVCFREEPAVTFFTGVESSKRQGGGPIIAIGLTAGF
jgi:hypothetical protein